MQQRQATSIAIQSTQAPVGTGDLGVGHLAPFFAITFALTWGLGAAPVVIPDQITAVFGALSVTNPLHVIIPGRPDV